MGKIQGRRAAGEPPASDSPSAGTDPHPGASTGIAVEPDPQAPQPAADRHPEVPLQRRLAVELRSHGADHTLVLFGSLELDSIGAFDAAVGPLWRANARTITLVS